MIHLYAIAEGLGELPAVEGIGGAEIRPRTLDDLELVVSEHDGAELEPTEEAVLAHARVVDALAAATTALLPARFTRAFEDEAALDSAVRGQLDNLRRALSHVRVRVDTWLDPWAQAQGAGYQLVQALLALGAGGTFGSGPGLGYPGYIPAVARTWRRVSRRSPARNGSPRTSTSRSQLSRQTARTRSRQSRDSS